MAIKENDVVRLNRSLQVEVFGENRTVVVPEGTLAVVHLVHGPAKRPEAFTVEIGIEDPMSMAIEDVRAEDVSLHWRASAPSTSGSNT